MEMNAIRVLACISLLMVNLSLGDDKIPEISENFILKLLDFENEDQKILFNEIWFNHEDSIGKISYTEDLLRTTYIADYNKNRVIEYKQKPIDVPNVGSVYHQESCKIGTFEEFPKVQNIFGKFETDPKDHKMWTSKEFFHFGKEFNFTLSKKKVVIDRGFNVSSYSGQFDEEETDEKSTAEMYWSGNEYNIDLVSGEAEGPIGLYKKDASGKRIRIFENLYFKSIPKSADFPRNSFEIPENIQCTKYQSNEPVPQISPSFQVISESTFSTTDGVFVGPIYSKIWYNELLQMVRMDLNPTEGREAIDGLKDTVNNDFFTMIWDVSTKVPELYSLNHTNGECSIEVIDLEKNRYFLESDGSIPSAQSFFFSRDNFEFKGFQDCLGAPCKVWSSTEENSTIEVALNDATGNNNYRPVMNTEIRKYETLTEKYQFFFYAFQDKIPGAMDLSGCLYKLKHRHYVIRFEYPGVKQLYEGQYEAFEEKVKLQIVSKSLAPSELNLQKMKIQVYPDMIAVYFVLFENKHGASKTIEEMEHGLQTSYDQNTFNITLKDGEKVVTLHITSFKRLTPKKDTPIETEESGRNLAPDADKETTTEIPEKTGFTTADVVGMAFGMLFLGLFLGVGLTYVYVVKIVNKRTGNRSMELNTSQN